MASIFTVHLTEREYGTNGGRAQRATLVILAEIDGPTQLVLDRRDSPLL